MPARALAQKTSTKQGSRATGWGGAARVRSPRARAATTALACYPPDCDVVRSEERHFVGALQQVKEWAPIPLPAVRWVDIEASSGRALDAIAAALG